MATAQSSTPETQPTHTQATPDGEWSALKLATLGLAILATFFVFIYLVSP